MALTARLPQDESDRSLAYVDEDEVPEVDADGDLMVCSSMLNVMPNTGPTSSLSCAGPAPVAEDPTVRYNIQFAQYSEPRTPRPVGVMEKKSASSIDFLF